MNDIFNCHLEFGQLLKCIDNTAYPSGNLVVGNLYTFERYSFMAINEDGKTDKVLFYDLQTSPIGLSLTRFTLPTKTEINDYHDAKVRDLNFWRQLNLSRIK